MRHVLEMLCFVVKAKVLFIGLPKEDATRNWWLSCIYYTVPEQCSKYTVPEQFNPNIRVCAAHFTEDYFLKLEE